MAGILVPTLELTPAITTNRVVLMPFGICLLWQDQHNIPATAFLFADPVNNYAWLCLLYGSGGRLPPQQFTSTFTSLRFQRWP
jgi:hypothetical protein